jgi:hypothetical protein
MDAGGNVSQIFRKGQMTVEERFEQIERLHAEHVQMARDDRAAHLAWKREMESQVNATWLAIDRTFKGFDEMRAQSQETDRHLKELGEATDRRLKEMGEATDERIGKLVSAIGDLIQRLDRK